MTTILKAEAGKICCVACADDGRPSTCRVKEGRRLAQSIAEAEELRGGGSATNSVYRRRFRRSSEVGRGKDGRKRGRTTTRWRRRQADRQRQSAAMRAGMPKPNLVGA